MAYTIISFLKKGNNHDVRYTAMADEAFDEEEKEKILQNSSAIKKNFVTLSSVSIAIIVCTLCV